MMNPLSLKGFYQVGGAVLLLLGILGFLLGGTPNAPGLFGQTGGILGLWLTDGENYAHVFLGLVALAALYVPGLNTALAPFLKWIAVLLGVVGVFFGVYSFVPLGAPLFPSATPLGAGALNTFGVAHLGLVDGVIHLVVGAWALYVSLMVKGDAMMAKKM
ncbi:MAG: hypothetical protein HY327_12850 [Chloroflexi bacterium]|nr:hypothetical protein [Chloroflexota bacterium]